LVSVFRVVTGLGTGGDYPMTSALCTEHIGFGSRAKRVLLLHWSRCHVCWHCLCCPSCSLQGLYH
jgi:MFS family permease